jgi:glycosyltransferase involved in cell wall biosynthesis
LTYRRSELLGESIESFLRQDFQGKKELIILNDEPEQEIVFNHPDVLIVNLKERLSTVGEKRDFAIKISNNDYIFPWDDDDIMLPNRISHSMRNVQELNLDAYKLSACFTLNGDTISDHISFHGGLYGSCCFSREKYDQTDGHPKLNTGEDSGFEAKLYSINGIKNKNDCAANLVNNIYYVYRWGGVRYHVSTLNNENALEQINERTKDFIKGRIEIKSYWKHNYVDMCKEVVNKYKLNN